MNNGLASLHKILKDETRRKIIFLLNEKGSLSYTDLMKTLEIDNTGRMNYHMKVLDDLILKRDDGQYALTERGNLASRLLREFPESNNMQKTKRQRIFWTAVGMSQVIILISVVAMHTLSYIDFARAVQGVIASISGTAIAYFGYRMQRARPEPISGEGSLRFKIAYTAGGAWLGLVFGFFGFPILSWLLEHLGGPKLLGFVDTPFEFVIFIIVGPTILGGIAGYYVGRRNGFNKPKWMTWIDNKLGF